MKVTHIIVSLITVVFVAAPAHGTEVVATEVTGDAADATAETTSESAPAADATTAPPAADATTAPPAADATTAPPAADTTTAAPEIGLAVAAKAGGTMPTSDLGMTYFVGLDFSYRLPVLERLLGVGLELSMQNPGASGTVDAAAVGGSYDYELSTLLITIAFEAIVGKSFGDFSPYGALGYGLFILNTDVVAFGKENSESQTRAGITLRGGCGYRLGPGDLFAELRYHYVDLAFLSTGESNAGGVTLGIGYRYGF